jgi:glycosyltransferase involved in cell wall biosynthesis
MVGDASAVPLISVVVPIHCVEPYLRRCLDSILTDPGTDLELVAVDDASPDRSGEIAAGYAVRDPRVKLVRLRDNAGLGPARNAGLARATGEYVWFVDSDDWLPAGAVAAVRERLLAHEPDVLIVDHVESYEDGRVAPPPAGPLPHLAGPVRLAQLPALLQAAQSACTKLVAPGWYEDSAFSHPLLLAAERIDVLDRVCYCYRQRDQGGITKTVSVRHFEVFEQYQRVFEFVEKSAPAYDPFLPELFRLMIDHYLVIVGNPRRVPPRLRRAFFRRMAADFADRMPSHGYELPHGIPGLKHRLVRRDAYRVYASLRFAHRLALRLFRRPGGTLLTYGPPGVGVVDREAEAA